MFERHGVGLVLLPYSYQGCAIEVRVRWGGLLRAVRAVGRLLICGVKTNVGGTKGFHVSCGSRKRGIVADFAMTLESEGLFD